ncbi:MAG: hypothetical protein ACLP6G_09290 [Terriglobales bacterium]
MAASSLDRLLHRLEECRNRFGRGEGARVVTLLSRLGKRRFSGAASLVRFHEALLFLRAFPHGPEVVRQSERLLADFSPRVERLETAGADMDDFDPLEVSGIAGTQMQDTLTFDVVRWLVDRVPDVEIVWDEYSEERALAAVWPRLMPLLEEDGYVEANIPWQRWLQTAAGRKHRNLQWMVRQFEQLPVSEAEKSLLYDSLRLPLRWGLGNRRFSRTRNWQPVRRVFFHHEPLIIREQVLLARELAQAPPALRRLSLKQGEAVMHMIREVMLVRYREIYGTTLGDPRSVVRADVGRGVSIYLWNLCPERRLPLRAYVAGFSLKNGVPINYIEAIGLCEWIELGFNTFYTFRGGEVAWIYAQALRCLVQLTGAKCISMYPYQLGDGNDEAIESGAFWFYRKLGFRPGRKDLLRLAEREEQRIARDPRYRTSPRTLRRLAAGHVFYELPGSEVGAWDTFSTRKIGMKVNQRMALDFGGSNRGMRQASSNWLARTLAVQPAASSWGSLELANFENFAMALSHAPGVGSWSWKEKQALLQIIRAKTAADEMRYLHLTRRHASLRKVLLKLGS